MNLTYKINTNNSNLYMKAIHYYQFDVSTAYSDLNEHAAIPSNVVGTRDYHNLRDHFVY